MIRKSQQLDSTTRGQNSWLARLRNMRAYNVDTKMYLHMSGKTETPTTEYAWIGSRNQYNNMGHGDVYTLLRQAVPISEREDYDLLAI